MNKGLIKLALKSIRRFSFKKLDKLVNKRQKFVLFVILLSLGTFVSEHLLGKSGIVIVFILSVLTDFFLFLSLREDLEGNSTPQVFILPFFYSLAFGLFYLLVPARLLTRMVMTSLYGVGLYSLFLSQNIFTVSSIRTIALVSGARTVSFTLTLLSFLFLSNVIFSFHINVFLTMILFFLYTFPLILQSIWVYSLEKDLKANIFWVLFLSICILEIAVILWFWPSSPTVLALFLAGIFYIIVGVSHIWFEKRLFRSVILEYSWVSFVLFVALILFTSWS